LSAPNIAHFAGGPPERPQSHIDRAVGRAVTGLPPFVITPLL